VNDKKHNNKATRKTCRNDSFIARLEALVVAHFRLAKATKHPLKALVVTGIFNDDSHWEKLNLSTAAFILCFDSLILQNDSLTRGVKPLYPKKK
jgi:hypothetical protein